MMKAGQRGLCGACPTSREAAVHYDAMRSRFGENAYGQFRNAYTEQDIFNGSDVQQIFEEMARSFGLRGVEFHIQ
jgi:hypothetical protein